MQFCFFNKIRKSHFIIVWLMINLIAAAGFIWYCLNTGIYAEIHCLAKKNCTVDLITPMGKLIHNELSPDKKVVFNKRPLKKIVCSIDGKTYELSDVDDFEDSLPDKSFQINFVNRSNNVFNATLYFFVRLKYHYPLVLANLLMLVLIILIYRNLIIQGFTRIEKQQQRIFFKIKTRICRYAIKNKPGKNYLNKYNEGFISKNALFVLIIIALIYVASLFAGIWHNNIIGSDFDGLRALTALEMKLSGNFVVPTVNGQYYYNKPPVYSYFLLPFADSEQNLEFKLRAVTAISVVLLGIVVFFIAASQLDKRKSLFAALLFSTSYLYYHDLSSQIILDPFFVIWIVLIFYLNFKLAEKNKLLLMFTVSYAITSVAFLVKGFPALYFQAVSIIAVCFTFQLFKKIFTLHHLAGILIFCLTIGAAILLYSKFNDPVLFLNQLFFNEPATKFNKIESNLEVLSNIFSFPGKSILYYSPILILLPLLFFKKNTYFLLKDRFAFYTILLSFLVFLPFFSGIYRPYYILCIVPLIVICIVKFFPIITELDKKQKMWLLFLNLVFIILVLLSAKISTQPIQFADYRNPAFLSLAVLSLVLLFPQKNRLVFLVTMFVLVTLRITVFNPVINNNLLKESRIKRDAERIIATVNQAELKLYPSNLFEQHASIFYLTYFYGRIINKADNCSDPSLFYLAPVDNLPGNAIIIDSVVQDYKKFNNSKKASMGLRKLILFKVPAVK